MAEPDLETACVDASQRVVNIALSRIGVSKQIAALASSGTIEAITARLHLREDVAITLRAFPWPFATRYATLVVEGGTSTAPVNADWQYSYRMPTDAAYVRRIVPQNDLRRRRDDPAPILFRINTDASGGLVYVNEATSTANPLVLEYTKRMTCPASQGDALFRDALGWKLAASLAPSLSREKDKAGFCLEMFERTLTLAETVTANEAQQEPEADAAWITGRN